MERGRLHAGGLLFAASGTCGNVSAYLQKKGRPLISMKLLLFVLLLIFCWPAALLVLVLYPIVWLILLPFRLVGLVVGGVFDIIGALFSLPGRLIRTI